MLNVEDARTRGRELQEAIYPAAATVELDCDLVMKGGITSGIVYPLAMCELAKRYRFRSIGGSSAGAIAAAMAAAAEYGRDSGGFNRLARLPQQIGPDLPKMFVPGPHTPAAHAALMACVDRTAKTPTKVGRVLRTLLASQLPRVIVCGIATLVIAVGAAFLLAGVPDDAVAAVRFAIIAVVLGAAGALATVGVALKSEATATLRGLAAQGFGICIGSRGPKAQPATPDDPGAFTDWLAEQIDAVAGLDRPLLVADLLAKGIDLQVMTTDLTRGRPMCFPFRTRVFTFDPVELADYFPPAVMAELTKDPEPAFEDGVALRSAAGRPLLRLPAAERLPVILAARMSMSFPGLISAVPLYAVDFAAKAPTAVRCWFSDGGITSNFPIHFFDRMWPSRPTFALDLRNYHPDYPDSDVYYAAGTPRQPRVTEIRSATRFVRAILDTMQYWADDAQSTLPGYRDRVVELHLHDHEGGMNLRMSDDEIAVLAEKGRQAAEALRAFKFDEHRWVRYLISMGRLQEAVGSMGELYTPATANGHGSVRDLIDGAPDFDQQRQSRAWAAKARTRTETLLEFAGSNDPDFARVVPNPETVLRITPRF